MKNQKTRPVGESRIANNPKNSISSPALACKRFPKNVKQMFIQSITSLSSLRFAQTLSVQILLLFALGILTPYSQVFAASASISWDPNTESDLAGYKLYKRTLPSQDFGQPIFSGFPSSPSSPTTTATGLSEGTTYGFVVTAFDTSGNESAPSIEKQFTPTTGTPPPPPPPGSSSPPLAHWTFDEGAGITVVDSANGHNGTVGGAAWTTSGRLNGALDFDGSNDFVDAGSWDVSGSAITIAMWLKADAFGITDARLLSKSTSTAEQDHYFMLSTVQSSGMKLRFRLKTDGTTHTLVANSGTLNVGQWIHAVAVYDGSTMRLYKDGIEVGSMAKTGALSTNNTVKIRIAQNPDGSKSFDGLMDDVRIYDRALTPPEIQLLAEGSVLPSRPTKSDINGDGRADLVWRNTNTGAVSGWLMNGLTLTNSQVVSTVGAAGWTIKGVGDLDGDGKDDLIWRNTNTGAVSGWLMNGTAIKAGGSLGSIPTAWKIQ